MQRDSVDGNGASPRLTGVHPAAAQLACHIVKEHFGDLCEVQIALMGDCCRFPQCCRRTHHYGQQHLYLQCVLRKLLHKSAVTLAELQRSLCDPAGPKNSSAPGRPRLPVQLLHTCSGLPVTLPALCAQQVGFNRRSAVRLYAS